MKLIVIFVTSLICFNYVISNEGESEDDMEYELLDNNTESYEVFNASDEYDYNELNVEEENSDDCHKQSFIERVKIIHEEGRNVTLSKNVKHINETFNVLKNAQKNLRSLFGTDERSSYEFLEFLTEIDIGLSNECLTAVMKIVSGLRKGNFWAFKFLDSMGRFLPPGFAQGIQSSFGEYDECLDIKSPKIADNSEVIKGQYCLMKVIIPFPPMDSYREGEPIIEGYDLSAGLRDNFNLDKLSTLKGMIEGLNLSNGTIFRIGICIPSVCSAHEIEHMLNNIVYPITRIPLEVGPKCHIRGHETKLDNYQIGSITILAILVTLVILSTGFEVYQKQSGFKLPEKFQSEYKKSDLFLTFSAIKNTQKLVSPNTKFAALDTFRLLFIINVHIGHIYQYTTSFGLLSLKKIFSEVFHKVYEDNKYVFARTPLMIDALFTLSGFLLSYTLLRKLERTRGRFNYIEFLFQRWIRFFILMFGSIIFFYLFPLTGDGPIWDMGVEWVTPGCKDPSNLMKMFLFINNFRPTLRDQLALAHTKCNPMTWFLSTLLQFMIIAPIFIILYYKKPILGLYATIAAIVISLFASISPQILFGIRPYLQLWELESILFTISRSFKWYHMTPNVFAISFFVGILFGYLMGKKVSFSRFQVISFWILSIIMILTEYFWHNSFWRLDESAPLSSVLLWHSFGKLFFSIGFAWIYYACCTGRGGILNRFLSWHGFQPIARLSFGIYLLHYLVVIHRVFSVKNIYVMSDKLMFEHIIFDLIIDTILAYIFYLLIESPFTNIFGFLVNRKSAKDLDILNNNINNKKNQISKL